jgi:hypothetical protein
MIDILIQVGGGQVPQTEGGSGRTYGGSQQVNLYQFLLLVGWNTYGISSDEIFIRQMCIWVN